MILYVYLCKSMRVNGKVTNKQEYVGSVKQCDLETLDFVNFLRKYEDDISVKEMFELKNKLLNKGANKKECKVYEIKYQPVKKTKRKVKETPKDKFPVGKDSLLESELEYILINNLENVEYGLKYIDSQVIMDGARIDILAEDYNGVKCIIELKTVNNSKDLLWQSTYYPSLYNEKVRMIIIAPDYTSRILNALTNLNYVELKTYSFDSKGIIVKDFTKEISNKELVQND